MKKCVSGMRLKGGQNKTAASAIVHPSATRLLRPIEKGIFCCNSFFIKYGKNNSMNKFPIRNPMAQSIAGSNRFNTRKREENPIVANKSDPKYFAAGFRFPTPNNTQHKMYSRDEIEDPITININGIQISVGVVKYGVP